MLLKCNFVLENKSLTSVGELLNPGLLLKSRRVFKLCFRMFPPGSCFIVSGELCWGMLKALYRVLIPAWGKEFRSLNRSLLYWGVEVELISGRVQVSQ